MARLFTFGSVKSIRFKVISMTLLLVFFSLSIIGIYFYQSIHTILRNNANDNLTRMLEQTNDNLEAQLEMIDSAMISFISNPVINTNLEDQPPTSPYEKWGRKTEIERQMIYLLSNHYLWEKNILDSVFIIDDYGNDYSVLRKYGNMDMQIRRNIAVYKSIDNEPEQTQIVNPTPNDPILYFVKNIRSFLDYSYKGKIIFGINETKMNALYDSIVHYDNSQVFLIDGDGSILSSGNTRLLGHTTDPGLIRFLHTSLFSSVRLNDVSYFVAAKEIKRYNWTSLILIPQNQALSHLSESFGRFIPIALGILFFFLLVGYFISSKVTRPIIDLLKRIELIRRGDYSTRMPAYTEMELNKLAMVFNKMSEEMEYLITDVYEKKLLLRESELKSLYAQINPHFLFNVLETISWYARMSSQVEIHEMVTSLGYMLRSGLAGNGHQKTAISEELKYIEFYILLQRKRFGERLQVDIKIGDDSIRDLLLPKLSIQPIVENAIVHGLERKVGDWQLLVEIRREGGDILFLIEDNGVGFDSVPTGRGGAHNHIALENVNRRIQILYGNPYGISIDSRIGEGTKVTVRIPEDTGIVPENGTGPITGEGRTYVPGVHRG
ncbi:sensor histidine kinase [Cohnella nanjingensis]|uniref:Sensor histidine kinase n=2 Tax=Cohnella nanjingensis TaxID=1387779 RepID=A0A7X0RVT6_9BACL|nr:sensor histidine kinase [Cohnella nanjingensis]